MSATSGGGGSVSEGSEAGGSSQSTMSVSDSPSTSFQANLAAENVTKITLSDDNGAGGYAADVTGSKINLTLDERQQKEGIVNVAFDYEGGTNRGGGGGGEFRSMNGPEKKDKVPEAVNLELVNMVPYSNGNGTSYGVPVNGIPGIPMKKDSEQVDMSTPYDEYFVPVNEHKKYMRGEKLYVTKDKRRPTSWRRCLSWIVACTVISAVLVVAILAGTGVILSQEPDLVKDASVGRNFAGSNLKPTVTDNSHTPTAEKLMYVPRSIESEFVIDNLNYDPALRDLNSSAYQQFTSSMEDHLKMLLFDKETLESGASDVGVKVVNISRDPFKVNYRIGWNYKQGVNNPPEPIKMEDVKRRLVESLARNQGYIDKYHIDREAIKVNHVINACQIENGGCSHICYYNYITQQFTCTCPTHLVLDNTGKNCVAWSGSSEDDAVPIPSHAAYPGMPYETTANPVQDYEYNSSFQPNVHQDVRHHQEPDSEYKTHIDHQHGNHEPTAEPVPEPTAEPGPGQQDKSLRDFEVIPQPSPEPTVKDNNSEGHGRDMHSVSITDGDNSQYEHGIHSSHETTGFEVAPEPTPEPTSEGKHHGHDIHSVYGFGEPTPEPTPEPTLGSTASKDHDHDVHSTYDSKVHVHPIHSTYDFKDHEPAAEPTAEPAPEPTAEPAPKPTAEPAPEPTAEPAPEPTAEPAPEPTAEPAPKPTAEPAPEPTAEPAPEPTAEPLPGSNKQDHIDHSVHGAKDHEPTPEPTPEPAPESDVKSKGHAVHSVYESKDHEPVPTAEPTPEPTPEPAPEPSPGSDDRNLTVHSVLESKYHEPTAKPTPESAAESTSGRDGHGHIGHSVHESKVHEPAAESTPEPTPEPAAEPSADVKGHAVHSLYETKYHELGVETTPGPAHRSQDEKHAGHSEYTSKDNEPVAEPTTPEPNPGHQDKQHGAQPVHETKDAALSEGTTEPNHHTKIHTVHRLPGGDQTVEPTPEPPTEIDHQTHFSNIEGSEHGNKNKMGTTTRIQSSQTSQDHRSLGPDSSLHGSSLHPVSSQEQTSATVHPERQSEVKSENKSGHHVPYLQDVLIRRPDSDLKNGSTTPHDQSVLQNVEVTANGEPVIEEVLIDRSRTKGQDESGTSSPVVTHKPDSFNVSERFKPDGTVAGSPNFRTETTSYNESVQKIKPSGDPNEIKTSPPESTSVGPTNVEQGTILQSNIDGKEMTAEHTENPGYNHESAVTSNAGHTRAHHFDSNEGSPKSASKIEPEHKSTGLLQDRMPGSTIQPEIRHEYHTIPVTVEFSSFDESSGGKPKQENQSITSESGARPGESHTTEKIHLGHDGHEGSTEIIRNSNGDVIIPSGGTSDQTSARETTTESHIATTMLVSMLLPDAIGEKSNKQQLTGRENENVTGLRETAFENHTATDRTTEVNQTTKSPGELSNSIKDELLDNEEFNTLIDKEHNKEGDASSGITNKYPSKSAKVEKKKIKDYVKGEKVDPDKKTGVTARPGVTPEDFFLQKHVTGHENTFDLDYSLQNEHTTKHDGEVTVIDPHGFDVVPGVSFKPHGINNNHDLKVLQTVAPDFRTQTAQTHELETQKPDSKGKSVEGKEGERQDKDYAKFDKDYKYEKQKVSKKKDLKKKGGSGKDGKNVELDDGRKYFTEVSREDLEISHETAKDISETMSPSFEKITVQPETGARLVPVSATETTVISEHNVRVETTSRPSPANVPGKRTEVTEGLTGQAASAGGETSPQTFETPTVRLQGGDQSRTFVDQIHHQMIDEPSVKTTFSTPPGTIYDGEVPKPVNSTGSTTTRVGQNSSGPFTNAGSRGFYNSNGTPGTVFDGIPTGDTTPHGSVGFETNATTTTGGGGYEGSTFVFPKIVTDEGTTLKHAVANTTTANPTIIIHGQSGNLQDGHTLRFANSTFHATGNATVVSAFNGTVTNPDGHAFTVTNYTTFGNGSTVQPTIIVRGQSGTLQDGHEIRFGNATFVTSLPNNGQQQQQQQQQQVVKNSTIYRIENSSLPGTVFDGQFNPQNGFYHMFSNSSGTFVYSNVTTQPVFVIKGEGGDFGSSRGYIMANDSGGNAFSGGFTGPSVIFRNSTVFAVGNTPVRGGEDISTAGIQKITTRPPHEGAPNETIHYGHQVSPSFFSTGTAYKVNDYFGYISKCAAGQFQCVNGTSKRGSACISLSSKCDSINDCSDGSDELGCVENGCPGNFQCSDGTCLKRNLVCNGILDCSDGSDEKHCERWKCEFDEFQCPSGRCIPVVWQCDGKPDCDNHTDEYNCQTSCGNDEFHCPEGWCVPLTYRCNGVKECSMGEDEQLCDCSHEEFKCQTGGCVSRKQICDGLDDCPDRSDEWDCVKLEPGSNLLKIRNASGGYEPVCADGWTSRNSDEVCASLGFYSSVPTENENGSSITRTETSFFVLKNGSTDNFNKKVIVNLKKSEGGCHSGKLVEIACQEFSCGSRSMTDGSSVEARLVGGMSATAGQWPSVALLHNVRNFHSCTANVLTPRWVLASYNCLKMGNKNLNEQDWKFFGGSTVFDTEKDNAETRKIVSIIPHPQVKFNQFLFSNDLALVELDQSLQFTNNLGAVCLPEQEMQPRQICVTAGWGMNTPEDKSIRQQLQYLPVPTMNLTECNSTEHYSGFITDDKICAGYNSAQKSLCYNEEGAPLMCVNDRGEWELQGVLSYHSNCGRGSHPSIFSSITPVTDWIKKTIGNTFERKAAVAVTKR